jgi:hypothetical protein
MDHNEAVSQMLAEKYLLDELPPESREQFEEHFFGCMECAADVKAGAVMIDEMKTVLAQAPVKGAVATKEQGREQSGWFGWLRPALAVPALIVLLAMIAYQNLVSYPPLKTAANTPQLLPWTSVNVTARGATTPSISARAGNGFLLFVNIPPDAKYSSYVAELLDPAGKTEWTLTMPATSEDSYPVRVPGRERADGTHTLVVQGVSATGERTEIGRTPFELHVEK